MEENKKIGRIKAILIGVKGGILSSLCCIPVIILVPILLLIGAQSFTLAFALTKYRTYFIILGFLFVIVSIRAALKKNYGCCDTKTVLKSKYIIAVALLTQISFFLISYYVVLPAVSNYVFTRDLGGVDIEDTPTSTIVPTPSTISSTTVTPITSTVIVPTCFDRIKNQGEFRIDCARPCVECGTIGVDVGSLSECSNLKTQILYVNLTDYGIGKRQWLDRNPTESFGLYCDNQTVKNLVRLEHRSYEDYFGPTNMYRKTIIGEYKLKISCNREYFIKDLNNCSILRVNVTRKGDWGVGSLNIGNRITVSSTSTVSTTSIPTTSTISKELAGYSQVTFDLNTYCLTCIPAAKYLLSNTRGVVKVSYPDPKKKIWIITYNQSITNPRKIMSRVRDFDPEIV